MKKLEKGFISGVCIFFIGVGLYLVHLVEPIVKDSQEMAFVVCILFMALVMFLTIKWCEIINAINERHEY